MIKHFICRVSSVFIVAGMVAGNAYTQTSSNPFTRSKGKTKAAGPELTEISSTDGRLYRNTIFGSAPSMKLQSSDHKTTYVKGSAVPVWIESRTISSASARTSGDPASLQEHCRQYLKSIAHLTKINKAEEEFDIISINGKPGDLHVKMQQKYHGVPIEGSQVMLHLKHTTTALSGRYVPTPFLYNTQPDVSKESAILTATEDLKSYEHFAQFSDAQKQLLGYDGPAATLCFLRKDISSEQVVLSWKVEIRPNMLDHYIYYVDAGNGNILQMQNHTCSIGSVVSTAKDLNGVTQTFHTYLHTDGKYYMIDISKPMFKPALSQMPDQPSGAIQTIDAHNTDLVSFRLITSTSPNTWSDTAVSAHHNADSTYSYYLKVHGRNSLDSAGGTIISVINVTDNGQPMDNAYWNGKFMAYGNGNVYFKPLAGGLDVAAHEMTHGVIQNSANLNYQGQSGAMNESFADIFGCMVDRNDWQIGEDVMLNSTLPLRDLSDPHNAFANQPAKMSEYVNTLSDNGGVHTNSGILNHAYYLFANAVGKNIAEQIYYKVLTHYLTASAQFIDLRLAVIQACKDLYPGNTTYEDAAKSAFDQVEIFNGTPTTVNNELPVNPGDDMILLKGLDGASNTLYRYDPQGSEDPILTTKFRKKPSVTDRGDFAYFVNNSGNIVEMNLQGTTPGTQVIDLGGHWDNVAVSKDGALLAAVTEFTDSSIYVKPTVGGSWKRFMLYNPTYSTGITTSGPQYADVLEWDYSGQTVMYDCYNLKVGSNNDSIDYWSIGFINVWDQQANTYGPGTIRNLFDGLPEYLSVGNPTYSKNSPNIIAFDMLDYSAGELYVIGTNIETGDAEYIVEGNPTLGSPSYARLDTMLAITTENQNSDTVVVAVALESSKISSKLDNQGYPIVYLVDTYVKEPVWYATGTRVLSTTPAHASAVSLKAFPNPFTEEVNLEMDLEKEGNVSIELSDLMGRPVKKLYQGTASPGPQSFRFSLADLEYGTYILKVNSNEQAGIIKLLKTK